MATPSPFEATILLLISDPLMKDVIRDALDSAGYQVVTAVDLGAAADRLREVRPDLLITRPYINSMPGQTAADYLRTKRPGLWKTTGFTIGTRSKTFMSSLSRLAGTNC